MDEIKLRSWQTIENKEVLYQEGTLKDILPVETILNEMNGRIGAIDNCVIFFRDSSCKKWFLFWQQF